MALTDSLIAYWKLDEASGTRNDSHGSNHLSDSSSTASGTGKIGNCADFEADSNNFLSISDNTDLSTGNIDFTLTCWLQLETKAASTWAVTKWNTTGNQREYAIRYSTSTDRLIFSVSNNGTALVDAAANNLGSPSTGTWYFVVAWHDAANNLIGIQVNNGTADTTSHSTGVFDSTAAFQIGRFGADTTGDWDGLVDEVGFWKRLLTADEKTALYNAGNGRTYPFFNSGWARGSNQILQGAA